MIAFQYIKPGSVESAIDSNSKDLNSAFIAGGTNLVDLMKRGVTAPEKLIDLNGLSINNIVSQPEGLYLGALSLNSVVAESPRVIKDFPLLSLAIKAGASQQIRNMATTGGNMMQRTRCAYFYDTATPCNKREPGSGCSALKGYNRMHAIFGTSTSCIAVHPSDMCVALSALNATVLIQGKKEHRTVPFTSFHRLPGNEPQKDNILQHGELIAGIQIPNNNFKDHVAYLKVRDRTSYAFALVSVAVGLDIQNGIIKDATIAMGGVAHKPWRLHEAEALIKGKAASITSFEKAAATSMKGAIGFGANNFKLKMAPKTIVEALKQASAIA